MVYAYDQWLPMPTKDLFDTQMMLASVNAAKDMYEKGLEEMKEFNKEYTDFLSPSETDMMWVKNNVTDPMRDTINQLYAAGIDPLRSKEGRALLAKFKNNIDATRMAQNKLTALYGQTYLENKAKLEAAGKYDPDLEERFLGYDLKNWDSAKGAWNRLSPAEAQSLKSLTQASFDNRTPHQLTKEDVEWFGMPYDPRAKYLGFTYNDLLDVANNAAVGLRGTLYEKYYKDLARQRLESQGVINPSDSQIDDQLRKDIANQNIEYMIQPTADYKDWQAMEGIRLQNIRNNILMENAKARQIAAANKGGGSGSGNGKTPTAQFDADDFLLSTALAKTIGQTKYGAKWNIGAQGDIGVTTDKFGASLPGTILKGAQSDIADEAYRKNTVRTSNTPDFYNFGRIAAGKMLGVQNTNLAQNTQNRLSDINPKSNSMFNLRENRLHDANLRFLGMVSNEMTPSDFAARTKRKRDAFNSDFVMMNKNMDASRIFSADEVALSAAGVDYPNALAAAKNKTKNLRSTFDASFEDGKTMMCGEGYFVGLGQHDGAVHLYQKIRIVNKKESGSPLNENRLKNTSYNDLYNGEVIYYDMGIDTQENPSYTIDGVIGTNRKITAESLSGDRALLKEWGTTSTSVKTDMSLPDLYGQEDEEDEYLDLDEDLIDLGD